MKIIEKDIFMVDYGVICHQTNCLKAFNSGVAKGVRENFPVVYQEYLDFLSYGNPKDALGRAQVVELNDGLAVANLFCQEKFGYDGFRYTSYGAWEKALPELKGILISKQINLPIYFPYLVGCDRGGGNFTIISEMIREYFPDAIFCKLPKLSGQCDLCGDNTTHKGIVTNDWRCEDCVPF